VKLVPSLPAAAKLKAKAWIACLEPPANSPLLTLWRKFNLAIGRMIEAMPKAQFGAADILRHREQRLKAEHELSFSLIIIFALQQTPRFNWSIKQISISAD